EGMDGKIGFESEPAGGSRFWFILPCSAEHQSSQSGAPATALKAAELASPTPKTVLYIEDKPANVEVVETILSYRPGIRLISVPDAVKGIEAAKSENPDLILLDIQLPGVNGLDAIGLLRACPQVRAVPIIALSAAAMPTDIERGRQAGFDQ